jgi:hypothetical protein
MPAVDVNVLLTAVPWEVNVPLEGLTNAVVPSFRRRSSHVFVFAANVTLALK